MATIFGIIIGLIITIVGIIVILKFPDRPGGTFRWGSIEISSKGAGLPIIVIGLACVIFFTYNAPPIKILPGCIESESFVRDKNIIVNIEDGSHNQELVSADKLEGKILTIKLTENRKTIGFMNLDFYLNNQMFKIKSILDAKGRPINGIINVTQGDNHDVIQNWDIIEMQIGETKYAIRLGYRAGKIMANYFERISSKDK